MKISVIMGVYNGEKGLSASIESILNQSLASFEFIICDDASTDSSLKIMQYYAKKDSRIKIIRNKRNRGLSHSLNKCLNESTGKYIARMDDDDIAEPQRFEVQYEFLESHPEYSVVGTSLNLYDESGIWGERIVSGERTKKDIYIGKNFAHPTTMMIKKDLELIGGYNETIQAERVEDYDLWCKFYYYGFKGFNLPYKLLNYQESSQSMQVRKYKYRINSFKMRIKWANKFDFPIYYKLYAIKPLLTGLIPNRVMKSIKKNIKR